MTAPSQPPAHLLAVAEYAALGEIESGYTTEPFPVRLELDRLL
jgi:hypothetical protein